MSPFVLDASVAASWLLPDEKSAVSDAARDRLALDGAIVPQLWHLEIRNILLMSVRRRRISAQDMHDRLEALQELPFWTTHSPTCTSR